mmetsp:Transcript_63362/g.142914  ORF Transcript_63362/g.142914 Transcript_63362/m.142914 type:complete len:308 (-) Transcript_63362:34-957(-)
MAELDAQVAARHHEATAQGHYLVDVVEGLGLLDLGADVGPLVGGHVETVHYVDQLLQVLALLGKGDANVVYGRLELEKVLGVLHVLLREGGAVDHYVGHVDALARLDGAAVHHLDQHLGGALHLGHLHFDEAVVHQEGHPDVQPAHQGDLLRGLEHGDAAGLDLVAVVLRQAKLEHVAILDDDWATGELADAEFGPLEVAEDLDVHALVRRDLADQRVHPLEVSAPPVGAIQPENVDPSVNHLRDHVIRPRRRAHRRHDLGPTRLVFGFVVLLRGIDREGVAHEVGEHGAVGETLDRVGGTHVYGGF